MGITGFVLSDGKTTLLFDPVVTRPSLLDVLFKRSIKSDPELVKTWIKKLGLKKVDGTFITHSHHDHSLDMPEFMKNLGGHLYGSSSSVKIAESFGLPANDLKTIKYNEVLQIGDFKITVVKNVHAPVILDYYFAAGPIEKKLTAESNAFDYRMGESFGFFIDHPQGNIVLQATSEFPPEYKDKGYPAGYVLVAIAKIMNKEVLFDEIVGKVKPKKIIPLHFDNFFKPIENDKIEYLFGVSMDDFKAKIAKRNQDIEIIVPEYIKPIKLY